MSCQCLHGYAAEVRQTVVAMVEGPQEYSFQSEVHNPLGLFLKKKKVMWSVYKIQNVKAETASLTNLGSQRVNMSNKPHIWPH